MTCKLTYMSASMLTSVFLEFNGLSLEKDSAVTCLLFVNLCRCFFEVGDSFSFKKLITGELLTKMLDRSPIKLAEKVRNSLRANDRAENVVWLRISKPNRGFQINHNELIIVEL